MIKPIAAIKVFDKFQKSFFIKILNKKGEGNLIMTVCQLNSKY